MYHTLEFLRSSRIVLDIEILYFVDEEDIQVFSAKATLRDSSLLYIRELTTKADTKYSYHWQARVGKLLCRWDNAPHHRAVQTFPHHKHQGNERNVLPSEEVTLEQVLNIVGEQFKSKKKTKS